MDFYHICILLPQCYYWWVNYYRIDMQKKRASNRQVLRLFLYKELKRHKKRIHTSQINNWLIISDDSHFLFLVVHFLYDTKYPVVNCYVYALGDPP
jgi:hypothetical protein